MELPGHMVRVNARTSAQAALQSGHAIQDAGEFLLPHAVLGTWRHPFRVSSSRSQGVPFLVLFIAFP